MHVQIPPVDHNMKVIGDGSDERASWNLSTKVIKKTELLNVIRDIGSAAHGTYKNKASAWILGPSSGGKQAYHVDNNCFLEDLR